MSADASSWLGGTERWIAHMDCYAVHRRVRIDAGPGVRAQADGDVIGETPLEIGILPQALRVVVPAEADAGRARRGRPRRGRRPAALRGWPFGRRRVRMMEVSNVEGDQADRYAWTDEHRSEWTGEHPHEGWHKGHRIIRALIMWALIAGAAMLVAGVLKSKRRRPPSRWERIRAALRPGRVTEAVRRAGEDRIGSYVEAAGDALEDLADLVGDLAEDLADAAYAIRERAARPVRRAG